MYELGLCVKGLVLVFKAAMIGVVKNGSVLFKAKQIFLVFLKITVKETYVDFLCLVLTMCRLHKKIIKWLINSTL